LGIDVRSFGRDHDGTTTFAMNNGSASACHYKLCAQQVESKVIALRGLAMR
jgi:hypothetical protein